jgi:hypothetical protein
MSVADLLRVRAHLEHGVLPWRDAVLPGWILDGPVPPTRLRHRPCCGPTRLRPDAVMTNFFVYILIRVDTSQGVYGGKSN